jgi:hypothetical protein
VNIKWCLFFDFIIFGALFYDDINIYNTASNRKMIEKNGAGKDLKGGGRIPIQALSLDLLGPEENHE